MSDEKLPNNPPSADAKAPDAPAQKAEAPKQDLTTLEEAANKLLAKEKELSEQEVRIEGKKKELKEMIARLENQGIARVTQPPGEESPQDYAKRIMKGQGRTYG